MKNILILFLFFLNYQSFASVADILNDQEKALFVQHIRAASSESKLPALIESWWQAAGKTEALSKTYKEILEKYAEDNLLAEEQEDSSLKSESKSSVFLSTDAAVASLTEAMSEWKGVENYHKRLIIGEADFSYTNALLEKHSDLSPHIIATELETENSLLEIYPDTFAKNIENLRQKGVKVDFGVDARNIGTQYRGKIFDRIQFNFPNDRSNYSTSRSMAQLMKEFFEEASKLQNDGNRVHVVIPTYRDPFYQVWYGIYDASREASYKLVKKRKFTNMDYKRYPKYNHCQTGGHEEVEAAKQGREFVFEKNAKKEKKKKHKVKKRSILKKNNNNDWVNCFPEIGEIKYFSEVLTDSDSSVYFSEDEK